MSERGGHVCPPIKETHGVETEGIILQINKTITLKNTTVYRVIECFLKTLGSSTFNICAAVLKRSSSPAVATYALALVLHNYAWFGLPWLLLRGTVYE